METISPLRVMVRGLGEAGRYPYGTGYVSLGANTKHRLSRIFLGSHSVSIRLEIWSQKN